MIQLDWLAGENTGGMLEVQCSPQALLYGGLTEVRLGGLVLTSEDPWLLIYCTQETKYWREPEQDTDHGPVWNVELGGFVPGDSAELRAVMTALPWWRWIVRGRDNQGLLRQAGNEWMALGLNASFGVDPAMSGDRGWNLRWAESMPTRPQLV